MSKQRSNLSVAKQLTLFTVDKQHDRQLCSQKQCPKYWLLGTPTSNIMAHYHTHHKDIHEKITEAKKQKQKETINKKRKAQESLAEEKFNKHQVLGTSSSTIFTSPSRSVGSSSSSPSMLDHIQHNNSHHILNKITLAITMNSLPHHLVDDPYFLDMLKAVAASGGRAKIPTRQKLRQELLEMGEEVKKRLLARLSTSVYPVTIAVDGWTNVNHDKVINVMSIHNGTSFYITSITNSDTSNTAAYQASQIQPIIQSMLDSGSKIVAISADNEAVNGAMIRMLQSSFDWLLHIPCAAHTIQLVTKSFLTSQTVQPLIAQAESIIDQFQRSKAARQELKKQCAIVNKTTGNRVLRIVPTRWSSTNIALKRQLSIKDQITYVMSLFNMSNIPQPTFWNSIETIISLLQPFQDATDIVQRDNVTLTSVATAHKIINTALHKHVVAHGPHSEAIITCLNSLDHHWNVHINSHAVDAVKYLSELDGRPIRSTVKEWIITWGAKFIKHFKLSSHTNIVDIEAAIQSQLISFHNKSEPFETRDTVLARQKSLADSDYNPRDFWEHYIGDDIELCHVAIALLSICPSEASVERSFSQQGLIHSDRRNRLAEHVIKASMMVKMNSAALSTISIPVATCSADADLELSSDDEQ